METVYKTNLLIARIVVPFVLLVIIIILLSLNIYNEKKHAANLEVLTALLYSDRAQADDIADLDSHVLSLYSFVERLQEKDEELAKAVYVLQLKADKDVETLEVRH